VKTRIAKGFDREVVNVPLQLMNIRRTELSPYDVKKGTRWVGGG
jgi:hypothetical protein